MTETKTHEPTARQIRQARAAFEQADAYERMIEAIEDIPAPEYGTAADYVMRDEIRRLRNAADELRDDIVDQLGPNFDEYL